MQILTKLVRLFVRGGFSPKSSEFWVGTSVCVAVFKTSQSFVVSVVPLSFAATKKHLSLCVVMFVLASTQHLCVFCLFGGIQEFLNLVLSVSLNSKQQFACLCV